MVLDLGPRHLTQPLDPVRQVADRPLCYTDSGIARGAMEYLLTRFTELFTIGTGFLLIRFARTFDDLVLAAHKTRFIVWLNSFSLRSLGSRLKDLNEAFVYIFDSIYKDLENDSFWGHIILGTMPMLLVIGLLGQFFPFLDVDLIPALAITMLSNICFVMFFVADDWFDILPVGSERIVLTGFSLILGVFIFLLFDRLAYSLIASTSMVFWFIVDDLETWSGPDSAFNSIFNEINDLADFRTSRVIATSVIAIAIGSFLFRESLPSMAVMQQSGWIIGGYVLINIMIDALSLWETRLVLGLSKGPLPRLGLIVALDIVLSAALFLALPFAFGELTIFVQAITFHGPQPWLGILFWSTFATSIIFYLFVIGSFFTGFLYLLTQQYVRLGKLIDIEKQPFYALGSVLGLALVLAGFIFALWPSVS